jgi:hypothetical protein
MTEPAYDAPRYTRDPLSLLIEQLLTIGSELRSKPPFGFHNFDF